MDIESDPHKAALNVINHGITFDEAQTVLIDPYAMTKEDIDATGEHRYITLGMSNQGKVLIVVWTVRDEQVRLISSWKATQPQRKHYERQF